MAIPTNRAPVATTPEIGRRILERLRRLSRELGTTIDIEGNVGVIRVGRAASRRD